MFNSFGYAVQRLLNQIETLDSPTSRVDCGGLQFLTTPLWVMLLQNDTIIYWWLIQPPWPFSSSWWWRCASDSPYLAAHIPWFWWCTQPRAASVRGALRGTCDTARRSKACKARGHWVLSSAPVVIFCWVTFGCLDFGKDLCCTCLFLLGWPWLPNMAWHNPEKRWQSSQKTSPSRLRPRFQTSNQGAASDHVWLNLLDGHLFGQGQRHGPHLHFAKGANGSVECIAVALKVSIGHVEQQLGNSLPTALSFTSFDAWAERKCIGLQGSVARVQLLEIFGLWCPTYDFQMILDTQEFEANRIQNFTQFPLYQ